LSDNGVSISTHQAPFTSDITGRCPFCS
jgi:hypothetical protein